MARILDLINHVYALYILIYVATRELRLSYVPMLRVALVHMLTFYITQLAGTV